MESLVINRIRRHLLLLAIFPMKSLVTNRIRRQLSLAIFSHGKSNKLQNIYCGWLYFPMESRVINRIRRHLLSLAIFSQRKL